MPTLRYGTHFAVSDTRLAQWEDDPHVRMQVRRENLERVRSPQLAVLIRACATFDGSSRDLVGIRLKAFQPRRFVSIGATVPKGNSSQYASIACIRTRAHMGNLRHIKRPLADTPYPCTSGVPRCLFD